VWKRPSPATRIPSPRTDRAVRFFGGKGGVGKTTCAAAHAWRLARSGRRVLVVSLDPAHSLGDSLGVRLGPEDRAVPGTRGRLRAAEVDAPRAFREWMRRHRALLRELGERGTYLRADEVETFLDLTLPGVDELMGLRELLRLARARPDHALVVDTAPTGHALRLLDAPAQLRQLARILDDLQAKHRALIAALARAYEPDDADRFIADLEAESGALKDLLAASAFTWVTHPEALAWEETLDGLAALRARGFDRLELLVNRVTRPPTTPCAWCEARVRAEKTVLAAIRKQPIPVAWLPEQPVEVRGGTRLQRLRPRRGLPPVRAEKRRAARPAPARATAPLWPPLPSRRRLVMFAGKGGVGKTSAAAAAALEAAARWSQRVLLLSADPAHSLADVLAGSPVPASVTVRELDASRAFAERRLAYRRRVESLLGAEDGRSGVAATFDRALARDLLEEAPPGLDELFALMEVEEALAPGRKDYDLVVLDSAPTGHALRLLAMPALAQGWIQALLRVARASSLQQAGSLVEDLLAAAQGLRRLRALLEDPEKAAVVVVAQPTELSLLETRRLVKGLRREGMRASALLVNGLRTGTCGASHARRTMATADRARWASWDHAETAGARRCWRVSATGRRALRRWASLWTPLPS
jgi:arsenite-transporting ATPase